MKRGLYRVLQGPYNLCVDNRMLVSVFEMPWIERMALSTLSKASSVSARSSAAHSSSCRGASFARLEL